MCISIFISLGNETFSKAVYVVVVTNVFKKSDRVGLEALEEIDSKLKKNEFSSSESLLQKMAGSNGDYNLLNLESKIHQPGKSLKKKNGFLNP